jgi:hypothetical protein
MLNAGKNIQLDDRNAALRPSIFAPCAGFRLLALPFSALMFR